MTLYTFTLTFKILHLNVVKLTLVSRENMFKFLQNLKLEWHYDNDLTKLQNFWLIIGSSVGKWNINSFHSFKIYYIKHYSVYIVNFITTSISMNWAMPNFPNNYSRIS